MRAQEGGAGLGGNNAGSALHCRQYYTCRSSRRLAECGVRKEGGDQVVVMTRAGPGRGPGRRQRVQGGCCALLGAAIQDFKRTDRSAGLAGQSGRVHPSLGMCGGVRMRVVRGGLLVALGGLNLLACAAQQVGRGPLRAWQQVLRAWPG